MATTDLLGATEPTVADLTAALTASEQHIAALKAELRRYRKREYQRRYRAERKGGQTCHSEQAQT